MASGRMFRHMPARVSGSRLDVEARAVDLAVVAVAELAAQDGAEERDHQDRHQRDDAGGGRGALVDRDAREVERKKPGRPKARKRFQFSKR